MDFTIGDGWLFFFYCIFISNQDLKKQILGKVNRTEEQKVCDIEKYF